MFDAAVCELDRNSSGGVAHHVRPSVLDKTAKRALDVAVALPLFLILVPILLVIACLIRLESNGPAFFRQKRGGLSGQAFYIYKFRTMTVMENGPLVTQARVGDPRVTPLGAFLRKTSMDELPQLINVLKGEMSLVGPRPHAVAHDLEFQERIPAYSQRFTVKPGITGLAQVRGFRGETANAHSLEGRVSADLEYIRTWSLAGDIRLLVATLKMPLDRRAY